MTLEETADALKSLSQDIPHRWEGITEPNQKLIQHIASEAYKHLITILPELATEELKTSE